MHIGCSRAQSLHKVLRWPIGPDSLVEMPPSRTVSSQAVLPSAIKGDDTNFPTIITTSGEGSSKLLNAVLHLKILYMQLENKYLNMVHKLNKLDNCTNQASTHC